ncbi:tyrosine-protein kinase ITK/TSK [Opisthocomus hoazin]|uniref:tyrosine-protein kinase ITK/TSK n=1 Tax=Opisthocomus hoazin TaxID=30419 RepID=UPI003F52AC87
MSWERTISGSAMNNCVLLEELLIKKSQQKRRTSPSNFKVRFFVLTKSKLAYYEHRHGKKRTLKGAVELSRIKCVEIVKSDIIIPCQYKYPFQIVHDNYILYVFAPNRESRQRWVFTLKEETRNNNSLVSKCHPDFWIDGKWRCCAQTEKMAAGCVEYDPTKNASKKPLPPTPEDNWVSTVRHTKLSLVASGFAEEDSSVMSWSHDCDSFLLHCSADHSSLVPGLKSCCAQENKMGVRNSQHRNLHTGAAQLRCLFFSRANIIGFYLLLCDFSHLFALGVLMWEVFSEGKIPYENRTNGEVVEEINAGFRLYKPKLASKAIYEVMSHCWRMRKDDRPPFSVLLYQLSEISEFDL